MSVSKAQVVLEKVSIEFPIYDTTALSLRARLLSGSVGAVLNRSEDRSIAVSAISDLSLCLNSGDRVAVVGHNGAGKSTLLKVLSGVYEPTSGSIQVDGRVRTLFDISLGTDPELTGYDNIYVRGTFLGLSPKEIDAKIDDIADFAELGDYLNLPFRTYSSGMQLRLAFAISTAFPADIVLIDEIIGVGDLNFFRKSNERLLQFSDTAGIVVIASHSVELLKKFCNKAIWLEKGRMLRLGAVDDVVAEYTAAAS